MSARSEAFIDGSFDPCPVLVIQAARDAEDALRLANGTRYGLAAAVLTASLETTWISLG
jgi:acyl-CoA reductase-like NAD-dependent aldehyde dehydrogenase